MYKDQKGFGHIAILLIIIVVAVVGFVGWTVMSRDDKPDGSGKLATATEACPEPLLQSPADVKQAGAVLYPGQTRGGDYKPHGGLWFGNATANSVEVKAPMDAQLILGSRYIEQGETQVLLEFHSACGVKYRFDHLLTLSPKFQAAVDSLPAAKVDDSRTTVLKDPVPVAVGEVVATAVGFSKIHNAGFDFGVYDQRQKNAASQNAEYVAARTKDGSLELAIYAICWLDYLPASDKAIVKALPGGDGASGKTSDYCK